MQVDLKVQMDGKDKLIDYISKCLNDNPKNVYIYSGIIKESGLDIIEEDLVDLKSNLMFVMSIDKKNTTKSMLESLLKHTKDVYVYNNNGEYEFDSSIMAFEYSKEAVLISSSANISEGGISDNISIYTVIRYNLIDADDKKNYKLAIKKMLDVKSDKRFVKLSSDYIEELLNNKEIFTTKQYVHNVKSISELLREQKNIKGNKKIDTDVNTEDDSYPLNNAKFEKFDLSNNSIDIEIPEDEVIKEKNVEQKIKETSNKKNMKKDNKKLEENNKADKISDKEDKIDKNNKLYDENFKDVDFDANSTLDIENMLFSKAKMDINEDMDSNVIKEQKIGKNKSQKDVIKAKNIDLNNVFNLIFQLDDKQNKGQDSNAIKIQNYINSSIPNFFELSEKGQLIEEDGKKIRERNIELIIVDVKNKQKYNDKFAKVIQKSGQSYVYICSDYLKNIDYVKYDIARIIKLSETLYQIEFVQKDIEEYRIWNKLCNKAMRLNDRRYGVM